MVNNLHREFYLTYKNKKYRDTIKKFLDNKKIYTHSFNVLYYAMVFIV